MNSFDILIGVVAIAAFAIIMIFIAVSAGGCADSAREYLEAGDLDPAVVDFHYDEMKEACE